MDVLQTPLTQSTVTVPFTGVVRPSSPNSVSQQQPQGGGPPQLLSNSVKRENSDTCTPTALARQQPAKYLATKQSAAVLQLASNEGVPASRAPQH
jgi:hypothetical protein